MSFIKKLPLYFFGFLFSAIIIFVILTSVGIISLSRMYYGNILRGKAEDYVKNSYGEHYYISNTRVDSAPSIFPFWEDIWGIQYTFSDKNKQENDFVIYVGNDQGDNKTITDERYHSANEKVYEKCVKNYLREYFEKYGFSEKEYKCEIAIEDLNYVTYTNYLLDYDNYDKVIADEKGIIRQLNVALYVTFDKKKPDNKSMYSLYEYFNKANYAAFRFAFIDMDEQAGKMDIYAGVSSGGQAVQNPSLQNELYIDPYYTEYYDVKYNNIDMLK